MLAFAHAPAGYTVVFFAVMFLAVIGAVALVEFLWKIEDPGTICFQTLDADTGVVLDTTLDESNWSETEKYRDAFETAIRSHPARHIIVQRVPVSVWQDETYATW